MKTIKAKNHCPSDSHVCKHFNLCVSGAISGKKQHKAFGIESSVMLYARCPWLSRPHIVVFNMTSPWPYAIRNGFKCNLRQI